MEPVENVKHHDETNSEETKREKRCIVWILVMFAVPIELMVGYQLIKLDDVKLVNLVGTMVVGCGGLLQLLAQTDRDGLTNWDWRYWARTFGSLAVALGGFCLAVGAWTTYRAD